MNEINKIEKTAEIKKRLDQIEDVLNQALQDDSAKWMEDVFFMQKSAPALLQPCKDLISRGGKRWRPLLMCLVSEALGGSSLHLAPLVEFCHTASLMHDDIEDDSPERRGKAAVHLLYGVDTAINSASFLYFLPLICIDSFESGAELKSKLYKLWALYMRRLHLGQSYDIDWHKKTDFIPSLDDYYTMCSLKTGSLARFAVEVALLERNMSNNALGEAAEKLGVGFQILDDVKNLTTGIVGKRRGDDIIEGKMSLPILLYLHGKGSERHSFVKNCFADAKKGENVDTAITSIIKALEDDNVLIEAEKKGRSLLSEAEKVFSTITPKKTPKKGDKAETACKLLSGFASLMLGN
jgi:octaprenyl-diphosphate synthase